LEKRRYNLGEILPEEPGDAEKLKVDLLNLEKKFVDTELSVAEIKEKLKNISISEPKGGMEDLTGMKERMEEIEDLIMVEQAALLELKKLIEEKGVVSPGAVSVPPEIETFKSTLDNLVNKKAETDSKLQNMERELARIKSVTVEKAPEGMIEKLNLLVKETEEKLERLKVIDEKARDIEMRLEKMKGLEGTQIEEVGKDMDALRNMVDKLTERIVSLEKTYGDIKEMPDLTKKIEEMKQAELPQAAELSGKISETNAIIQDLTNRLNELNKKIELLESVPKGIEGAERKIEDITPLVEKRLEEISKEIPSIIESQIGPLGERISLLEKNLTETSRKIEGIKPLARESVEKIGGPSTFETQINVLIEKTVFLESRLGALERIIRETIRAQPVVLE